MSDPQALARLQAVLVDLGPVAVAASGGVDSMTLAAVAHQVFGNRALIVHAVSPAVPPQATARVEAHARAFGWNLKTVDAEEFKDERYLANPVNRCFYCKFNLYDCISGVTDLPIVSGTNTDDLSDYRPGLEAARDHQVQHPLVTAGIDKPTIRQIARDLGLDDLSELPAAPCLSSRLQTGVTVTPERLQFVNKVERYISELLAPETVRCRILAKQVEIQLDPASFGKLDGSDDLRGQIAAFAATGQSLPIKFAAYRQGSAFVHSGT
ncbi:MAG: adenine nucleotide alpha hydrolase [Rhodospirillales bacterium]|nr:adenine nucleotide alpha hydrolase [Rhodospirillales bacterium]